MVFSLFNRQNTSAMKLYLCKTRWYVAILFERKGKGFFKDINFDKIDTTL